MADDRNAPATKGDLEDAVAELRSEMKSESQLLRSEMQHMHDGLKEAIRDTETKLLQAFYGFAEANHKHLAQLDMTSAMLMNRVSTLEERVFEVEKRLNIPPRS